MEEIIMKHNISGIKNEVYSWEEIAKGLWELLDDIDTSSDMFKPEINNFYRYVMKKAEQRGKYGYSEDGYSLKFNVRKSGING